MEKMANPITRRAALGVLAGGIGGTLLVAAWSPGLARADSYDPSLEGAIIRRPWDARSWWVWHGARRWIPDGTTYMAICVDNGYRSYDWSDDQINSIPEGPSVPSRIPTGYNAANWAAARVGWQMDQGWCLRFDAEAYNVPAAGINTAIDAWNTWGRSSAIPSGSELLPGMLVYFDKNAGNNYAGHTGIYMGDGTFVSATDVGVERRSVADWHNQIAPYLGFSEAPYPRWPGF